MTRSQAVGECLEFVHSGQLKRTPAGSSLTPRMDDRDCLAHGLKNLGSGEAGRAMLRGTRG